jgi:hypothetical protein
MLRGVISSSPAVLALSGRGYAELRHNGVLRSTEHIEEGRDSSFQSPGLVGLSSQSWLANYYGPPSAAWHGVSTSGVVGSSCGWQPFRASSLALRSRRGGTVGSAL